MQSKALLHQLETYEHQLETYKSIIIVLGIIVGILFLYFLYKESIKENEKSIEKGQNLPSSCYGYKYLRS